MKSIIDFLQHFQNLTFEYIIEGFVKLHYSHNPIS